MTDTPKNSQSDKAEYIPYEEEWKKEMNKLSKADIIDMFAESHKEKDAEILAMSIPLQTTARILEQNGKQSTEIERLMILLHKCIPKMNGHGIWPEHDKLLSEIKDVLNPKP